MSKLFYFATNAALFCGDAVIKRFGWSIGKSTTDMKGTPTFVIGFSPWKSYIKNWFPEREFIFLPRFISTYEFKKRYWKYILADNRSEVFIWGKKVSDKILSLLKSNGKKCNFIEDGFLRSIALGATKAPPYSLTIDSKAPYFDATQTSNLEDILNNYDFASDKELMQRAEKLMAQLTASGISKYNNSAAVDIKKIYGRKQGKRVLVIGQVEDDASIKLGCNKLITNNDLVKLAVAENEGAQIIYKPHPDVMNGYRKRKSHPREVQDICMVMEQDIPLAQAFEGVDRVYTITSLGGFEALMRGIEVVTLGCPFYGGWGVTDTRQKNERRKRNLSVTEIFAASYLLYAKYFNPANGKAISAEEALKTLIEKRNNTI